MTERNASRDHDTVDVICDDPRHPRGKKTKWRFHYNDDDGWASDPYSLSTIQLFDDPDRDGYRYRVSCNLCPTALECTDETLQRVLNATRSGLLAEDETRGGLTVSLWTLCVIASRRT